MSILQLRKLSSEQLGNLPTVTQLINGRTTTHPAISDSKIHALNHDLKLPVESDERRNTS